MGELISEWYERNNKPHQGQTGSRKQHSFVDEIAKVVNMVEQKWNRGKIAALLLMDFKGEFDPVSRKCLLWRMRDIKINDNFFNFVGSYMTDRRVQLIIDRQCRGEVNVESRVT